MMRSAGWLLRWLLHSAVSVDPRDSVTLLGLHVKADKPGIFDFFGGKQKEQVHREEQQILYSEEVVVVLDNPGMFPSCNTITVNHKYCTLTNGNVLQKWCSAWDEDEKTGFQYDTGDCRYLDEQGQTQVIQFPDSSTIEQTRQFLGFEWRLCPGNLDAPGNKCIKGVQPQLHAPDAGRVFSEEEVSSLEMCSSLQESKPGGWYCRISDTQVLQRWCPKSGLSQTGECLIHPSHDAAKYEISTHAHLEGSPEGSSWIDSDSGYTKGPLQDCGDGAPAVGNHWFCLYGSEFWLACPLTGPEDALSEEGDALWSLPELQEWVCPIWRPPLWKLDRSVWLPSWPDDISASYGKTTDCRRVTPGHSVCTFQDITFKKWCQLNQGHKHYLSYDEDEGMVRCQSDSGSSASIKINPSNTMSLQDDTVTCTAHNTVCLFGGSWWARCAGEFCNRRWFDWPLPWPLALLNPTDIARRGFKQCKEVLPAKGELAPDGMFRTTGRPVKSARREWFCVAAGHLLQRWCPQPVTADGVCLNSRSDIHMSEPPVGSQAFWKIKTDGQPLKLPHQSACAEMKDGLGEGNTCSQVGWFVNLKHAATGAGDWWLVCPDKQCPSWRPPLWDNVKNTHWKVVEGGKPDIQSGQPNIQSGQPAAMRVHVFRGAVKLRMNIKKKTVRQFDGSKWVKVPVLQWRKPKGQTTWGWKKTTSKFAFRTCTKRFEKMYKVAYEERTGKKYSCDCVSLYLPQGHYQTRKLDFTVLAGRQVDVPVIGCPFVNVSSGA